MAEIVQMFLFLYKSKYRRKYYKYDEDKIEFNITYALLWAVILWVTVFHHTAIASTTTAQLEHTCNPTNCINGYCINGSCICYDGWQGSGCQYCSGKKELTLFDEEEIMNKRNKSKLGINDRNILNELPPYDADLLWFHETIRYKRRMLGRYGTKGLRNVPVGALWPTESEIEDRLEYERVAFPNTLQEDWALIAKRNEEKERKIKLRDEEVTAKMAKVDQWRRDYEAKVAKKEAEIKAAQEKRERLIEDIRREFGYKIDPRDDKFKEALAKKEKEDRKRKKEARKESQNARFMAQLLAQAKADNAETQPNQTTEEKKE
ncbi:hypothetical protein PV327_001345 [Microctonus hyperodae]|uniref:Large ribosomal subunit protein mL64 n=1 Tax=Microctonus hyperodae TaxID=165561 RepID=A0AA39G838_MICHY|nr:hypothetical protein PV327_001345 [Microctonus hyperodae]